MMNKPILKSSSFIVSDKQMSLDTEMVPFDIWGTKAHLLMLLKEGVIEEVAAKKCLKALSEIEEEFKSGRFTIDPGKGAQLSLEASIIEKCQEAGYSVHTGRSRNDQVMVTELLFLREKMLAFSKELIALIGTLYQFAVKNGQVIMPGYTHMQPAKVTTIGQWSLSYIYGLLRSLETIKYYFSLYDQNPLGACESYGTSWTLDRELTAKYLGFDSVWEMPQDAISSRGFVQLGYLTGLSEACLILSKINEDLILFNTFEYGMVELGDEVSQRMHPITGSSVMAQKKNPDVLEIIRSTTPQVLGFWSIVANTLASLPMGYNRDARESKEYISLGLEKSTSAAKTMRSIISTLKIDNEKMMEWVKINYSLTTDLADYISQKSKIGYRLIYKIIGQVADEAIGKKIPLSQITAAEIINKAAELKVKLDLSDSEIQSALDPGIVISKRKNIGGASHKAMLSSMAKALKNIKEVEKWISGKEAKIKAAFDHTNQSVKKILS